MQSVNTIYNVDFTTKQVAAILDVHRDTIIYWEENKLIPVPRRNPKNNYRIYNYDEIMEIAQIRGISGVNFESIKLK